MQARNQLIGSIIAYGAQMRFMLAEANIKQSFVELPPIRDKVPTVLLEEGLEWIKSLHDVEYAACLETKALVSDEQWEQYRFLDMDGAAEVIRLKKDLRALRKKIISKTRPTVFRNRGFNVKGQSGEPSQGPSTAG